MITKPGIYKILLGIFLPMLLAGCRFADSTDKTEPVYIVSTIANILIKFEEKPGMDQISQGISVFGDNAFVTDFFNHVIYRVSLKTGKMEIFAGVLGVAGFNDGNPGTALFFRPFGILVYNGDLLVADSGNSVIRKISIATGQVSTFIGKPGVGGHLNGYAEKATFRFPCGIAIDEKYLYVADSGNSTLRKVELINRHVSTIAGMAGVAGRVDGTGNAARFNTPKAIATDGKNVYVADTINGTIRQVVVATGEVRTLAGMGFQPGSKDGFGNDSRFNNPLGIAMFGNDLIVADSGNDNIRKINIEKKKVTTIAGQQGYNSGCPLLTLYLKIKEESKPEVTSESANGEGTQTRFKRPSGITTDGKNIYVIDSRNHQIRMLKQKE